MRFTSLTLQGTVGLIEFGGYTCRIKTIVVAVVVYSYFKKNNTRVNTHASLLIRLIVAGESLSEVTRNRLQTQARAEWGHASTSALRHALQALTPIKHQK